MFVWFIFLPDCGHTIEVDGLDHWMQMKDDKEIRTKGCPRCKTITRTCLRYGDVLKANYEDVVLVKKKLQSSIESVQTFAQRMKTKLSLVVRSSDELGDVAAAAATDNSGNTFKQFLRAMIDNVANKIEPRKRLDGALIYSSLDADDRHLIQVKVAVMDRILEVLKEAVVPAAAAVNPTPQRPMIAELQAELFTRSLKLLSSLNDRRRLTDSEYQAFMSEITRLSYVRVYYTLKNSPFFSSHSLVGDENAGIENLLMKNVKILTDADRRRLKELMEKMAKKLQTGLRMNEKERQEIVKALGLAQGHWFKCRNGHFYAVGECGGAIQESKCNECGARIGGGNHGLLADN